MHCDGLVLPQMDVLAVRLSANVWHTNEYYGKKSSEYFWKLSMRKYIFITGGVLSSLGKGIAASAIGTLLEGIGYTVSFLKLDPYLNVDPGTMSPYEHGEVFVTDDGAETDLDLGHYERFTNVTLSKRNNATAGQLYARLLEKERLGTFLGQTVQTIPHFTNEIKDAIRNASDDANILIVEVGGTVGDIEGLPFIEAIRQLRLEVGPTSSMHIHVTYIPYIAVAKELKTKPTQHSVKELRSLGIQPDSIIGRACEALSPDIKKKIALFTNVAESSVFSAPDLKSIYEAPLYFDGEGLGKALAQHLNIPYHSPNLKSWRAFLDALAHLEGAITVAIVGKYVDFPDAYKSIHEALIAAQAPTKAKITIDWVDAETLTPSTVHERLKHAQCILVPGGFGERGVEGKILAARYARERKVPYLGICLGMQVAVIEFARNVLGYADAHSTEFDKNTTHPVVALMKEQAAVLRKGGTMRVGSYPCTIVKGSKAYALYKSLLIHERHRHRYEFNPRYVKDFEKEGLIASGMYEREGLPEIIELREHPFFVACQFHPEFKSKPLIPHPLFVGLIKAACVHKKYFNKL